MEKFKVNIYIGHPKKSIPDFTFTIEGEEEMDVVKQALNMAYPDGLWPRTRYVDVEPVIESKDSELIKKLDEWKELSDAKEKADDHTRCPKCREQLYFCDCCAILADDILIDYHEWFRKKAEEE